VPVPVLEIEPEWLATWARLVTGTGGGWLPAAALLTDADGLAARCTAAPRLPEDEDPVAPAERVRNFRAAASPAARQLASHLALAPLTLDVMRHVKKAVLPRLGPLPLAEVLLSGLLERPAPAAATGFTGFAFRDGVRNQLLGGLGRGELFRALQGVSAVAAKVIGARPDLLPRYLATPDGPVDDRLSPADRELAAAAHPALLALGRPYSRLARKVRVLVDPSPPQPGGPSGPSGVGIKGETMSGSAPDTERLTSPASAGPPGAAAPPPAGTPRDNGAAPDGPPGSAPDQTPGGAPPGGAVRAPGSIPLPNANFTGREEHLRMLRSYLTEGRRAAVLPQALYGLGGVGKTQLAIEYIRRYAEEYELVWWVRAEQPAVIRTSLSALGATLGIEGPDVDGVVDKVISALASGFPVKRWLLVLDNALGPEEVMPYIPHMVGVPGGAGHVIITSRDGGWADQVSALKVDVFTREESVEFLRRRDTTMTGADASRLADALGDLPLAIEQAAAWQVNSGVQVEEYLGLLASRRSEVFAEPMTVGGAESVAAVWQVSMDSLRSRNAGALELLRLLAFFGPEPVPLSLLHNARLLSLPAALSRTVKEPLNRARAIRDIGRYSLLTIDNRAGTVQLHRLVRSVLQDGLSTETAEGTAHLAHLLLSAHDPGDPEMLRNWEQYTEILPHVETSGMLECEDPDVCHTVLNVVRYLLARGDFRSGVELAKRALKEWRRRLGPDDLRTISLIRLLGAAQRSLGRLDEAREMNADALRRLRATVGEEHEDTLNLAGGVAADLRATGRFREALELDEDTYAKSVRVFGTDDPNTLMAGHNYAVSLRLSGRFAEARELDRKVWQVRAMVLGATARSTLFTVNNLARDMRECGEYAEARTLQEQTVATYRQYYGETHPHTLRAIKNLSVSCRKAGDYERGLELAVLVLDHYRRSVGDRHPDALAALTNLGNDLRATGDLQAAGQRGAEAHQGYRDVLGEHHPYTYLAALNHAVTLRALGEHPRAHRLDQDTAPGIAGALWADHPWVLLSRANLATGLARLGNHEESRALNTEISARLETLLGDSHPSTLAVLRNLALDLETAGEPDRSRELRETVLGRYRATIGDDHPEARDAAEGLRAEWDIEPPPS
jgi:tetratricopeptide (TPR) repeat protein